MSSGGKRNSANSLLAAISRNPAGASANFRRERKPAGELCRPGFRRLTVDLPAADHARFKSACAAHSTTMHAEIASFVRAAGGAPDRLLSEALFLEISPEFKAELLDYAAARRSSLADLLLEAFAQLKRQAPEIEARTERRTTEPARRNIQVRGRRYP